MLELAAKVYGKHIADGAVSPLNTLTDYDWAKTGTNIAFARSKHNEAEELKGKMEAQPTANVIY